jgi:uncharacterized metal-binding protein YceD (DUF177 family)
MPPASASEPRLRVSALGRGTEHRVLLEPEAEARAALAEALGATALRKLRLQGVLKPLGNRGWQLDATLGATAVQPCIVTLEPVTTRIDTPVTRRFVPAERLETHEAGSETEMPEDDSLEPLGEVIDLWAVLSEALALALPAYPRAEGADLAEAQFAEDGVTPLRDEDVKPFAGLAGLREKMRKDDEEG